METIVPLKYLSSFWWTLEICEINLVLTWSVNCIIAAHLVGNQVSKLARTDTKFYVVVVTYQLKIMQNYYNNWNHVIKEQVTGININQK